MLKKILIILFMLLSLAILTGCSDNNNDSNNKSKSGYFTYIPISINGKITLIPIWHSK